MHPIRRMRLIQGFTQADFAAAIGTSATTLSCVESGRRVPTPALLETMARVLNVDVSLLQEPERQEQTA